MISGDGKASVGQKMSELNSEHKVDMYLTSALLLKTEQQNNFKPPLDVIFVGSKFHRFLPAEHLAVSPKPSLVGSDPCGPQSIEEQNGRITHGHDGSL